MGFRRYICKSNNIWKSGTVDARLVLSTWADGMDGHEGCNSRLQTDSRAVTDGVKEVLESYVSNLGRLAGAQPETRSNSYAYRFDPVIAIEHSTEIEAIFRRLVTELSSTAPG